MGARRTPSKPIVDPKQNEPDHSPAAARVPQNDGRHGRIGF